MTDLNTWQTLAAKQPFSNSALIAGRAHAALSGETFAVRNPATNALLANVAACGDADIALTASLSFLNRAACDT